jgi:hypothetical protein
MVARRGRLRVSDVSLALAEVCSPRAMESPSETSLEMLSRARRRALDDDG